METPVPILHPGQRLELDITTVAFGGDGIGRVDNFVVFVPFVIEGERVEVEIVEVKRRYATADLVRVITASPRRVEPRCPYYAKCAGCQYQHIAYAHQLELKRRQIRDVFQRIGKMADPPIEPVVGSPREYHYRNKIVVHGPGKPGFWSVRGRSIIGIEQCPIAGEEVNAKLAEVAQQSLENVHLTIRSNSERRVWTYTETRRANVDPLDADESTEPAVVETITETILGKTLQVPLGSFFQVNREVIELALEHVRKIFAASGCKILVDAYCGVGLFALMLADLAGHVYGIEEDSKAIQAANENAQASRPEELRFLSRQDRAVAVLYVAPVQTRRDVPDPRSAAVGVRPGGAQDVAGTQAAQDHLCVVRAADAGAGHQAVGRARLSARARHAVRHVSPDRPLRGRGGTDASVTGHGLRQSRERASLL